MSDIALVNGKYKKLTREEETDLHKKMHEGDIEARNRLYDSCIPWTIKITTRFAKKRYGSDLDDAKRRDIIQAGLFGLLECLKRFDPTKGRLSTYSYWWIRKECLTWAWKDRTIQLPRYLSGKSFEEMGISTTTHLRVGDYRTNRDKRGSDITPKNATYEHKEFDEIDNKDEEVTKLGNATKCLTEREQQILQQRANGLTLSTIGVHFGISRERVRQIQNRAISDLKQIIKQKGNSNGKTKEQ